MHVSIELRHSPVKYQTTGVTETKSTPTYSRKEERRANESILTKLCNTTRVSKEIPSDVRNLLAPITRGQKCQSIRRYQQSNTHSNVLEMSQTHLDRCILASRTAFHRVGTSINRNSKSDVNEELLANTTYGLVSR